MGFQKFEFAHTSMGASAHFQRQSATPQAELDKAIDFALHDADYPRWIPADEVESKLPVVESTPATSVQ